MGRYLLFLLCLAFVRPGWGEERSDFRRALFAVLRSSLDRAAPTYSNDLIAALSGRTGLDEPQIRTRLLHLLDRLERHAGKKTALWKELIRQGGEEVPPESAGKLLRNLIKESRVMLGSGENYLVDSGIRRAARKARLPAFQGRSFLVRALEWALADSGEEEEGGIGIVVSGHTNRFEVNLDPLFLFFDSSDESYVREQVREIQRFIVPALVRSLPKSPAIQWAVRKRQANALVEPRYLLDFGVDGLRFTGSNLDLRPCIEATVELRDAVSGEVVLKRALEFCTTRNGSKTTRVLTPFYGEVADQVRELVDEFLAR